MNRILKYARLGAVQLTAAVGFVVALVAVALVTPIAEAWASGRLRAELTFSAHHQQLHAIAEGMFGGHENDADEPAPEAKPFGQYI